MGFNIAQSSATIYNSGTKPFTGTTLEGIGQAVVGVLLHPAETANRFVKVLSIQTCQNELLNAFEAATRRKWDIQQSSTKTLLESGQRKLQAGFGGWVLDLVVAQLFDEGESAPSCVTALSRGDSDADLLCVKQETAQDVVAKVLQEY